MSSCCDTDQPKQKKDWLFIGSFSIVVAFYAAHFLKFNDPYISEFSHHVFSLMNTMWWGVVAGIIFVGLLSFVPQNYVIKVLGHPKSKGGIFRATMAGLLLDLCSHGILMVGMNLYKKGASLGQVMAFLIASPWNSISLTFILISLIGLPLTLLFIFASAVIAIVSGLIFIVLVEKGVLPDNPNYNENQSHDKIEPFSKVFSFFKWRNIGSVIKKGFSESKMVLKWLLVGVVLASLMRIFIEEASYVTYFGGTALGMMITFVFSTILEVCSEGATPIAADIVTKAGAPGNGFMFLMNGVSTDYTEIMSIKETTKSWKIALFLPLVTIPQILVVSWLINFL